MRVETDAAELWPVLLPPLPPLPPLPLLPACLPAGLRITVNSEK
jgi:hypothetical protein